MSSNLLHYKLLFLLHRKGSQRQTGQELKLMSKIIILLLGSIVALLFIGLGIALIINSRQEDFELDTILQIATISLIPFLIYDFIIRLSFPFFSLDELAGLYLLPISKKQIARYKSFSSIPDTALTMWSLMLIPICCALNYINTGLIGLFYGFTITYILICSNKLVAQLFKLYYNQKKLKTILYTVLYYISLSACILVDYHLSNKLEQNPLLTNLLFPSSFVFYIISIALLTALFISLIHLTSHYILHFKVDQIDNDELDLFKSKRLGKSTLFNHLGKLGKQLQNDILFILRNKKLKVVLYLIPLSILLIVNSVSGDKGDNIFNYSYFWFIYSSLITFISFPPYEATYYELYATKKKHFYTLLKSKYIIANTISFIVCFTSSIIICLYKDISFLSLVAIYSFNPGIISLCLLQMYPYQKIAINPTSNKKANQNYNGLAFVIMILSGIICPLIITITRFCIDNDTLLSLTFIIFNTLVIGTSPLWIKYTAQKMRLNKYKNLESIRNSLN